MGLDTHMIAGGRACSTSTQPTHPTITNETSPHYDETLGMGHRQVDHHTHTTAGSEHYTNRAS